MQGLKEQLKFARKFSRLPVKDTVEEFPGNNARDLVKQFLVGKMDRDRGRRPFLDGGTSFLPGKGMDGSAVAMSGKIRKHIQPDPE